jgi:hypothetical protein
MRYVRLLAFGLAALTAVAAVGCCHTCGGPPAAEQRGYYSPCCGTPAPAPAAPCCGAPGAAARPAMLPPTGYPTSAAPGAPSPDLYR